MLSDRHHCEVLDYALGHEGIPVTYDPVFREISIQVMDGGTAGLIVEYCPFCGTALGPSLRDEWFERISALGLDPEGPDVPDDMRSDRWWQPS